MLKVVTTGAYYPPVVTTWKILTTGASQLTAGSLCSGETSCVEAFEFKIKIKGIMIIFVEEKGGKLVRHRVWVFLKCHKR